MPKPVRDALNWIRVWAVNASLAAIWLWFAKTHLVLWLTTGDPRGIGAMAIETVVAVLFLTRRSPLETNLWPVAWAATIVGALGPMFMRPTSSGGAGTGALLLQLAGASFAVLSLVAIGRSFGLVAANRGIVARGPYRLVRHPIYFGYFVTQLGYVLENPSQRNVTIFACATLGQLVRIRYEEQVLSRDSAYAAYRRRVRFRLIPYLY
jgi:protein-S-isoprenylcysteine O-methyltransferase Ste14